MHRPRWCVLFVLLFLSLLFTSSALAATPSFSGTYTLDEGASDDVLAAFEPALQEMNIVKRTAARQVLRRRVQPERHIRIAHTSATITIQDGSRPALEVPEDGREVDITTVEGNAAKISARVAEAVLRVNMNEEKGRYRARYSLSPDGRRLTVRVNLDYQQLPKPVSYKLVYTRQ